MKRCLRPEGEALPTYRIVRTEGRYGQETYRTLKAGLTLEEAKRFLRIAKIDARAYLWTLHVEAEEVTP